MAGTNPAVAQFGLGEVQVGAEQLEVLLNQITGLLDPSAPVAMSVSRIHFASGQDLLDFCAANRLPHRGE